MLEDRYHRGNYHEVTDRADAPLEDAVALVVRERLTGKAPPKSGRKVVELWRDWIEERAGEDLARLSETVADQGQFADAVRDMIASLDMADELGGESGEDDEEDSDEGDADEREGASDQSDAADAGSPEEVEAAADDAEAGEGESSEADAEEMMDDGEMSDSRDTGEARRALAPFSNLPPNSIGSAPISTSSSPTCRARCRASPTACSGG
jgi:cobaltochelatase CobT